MPSPDFFVALRATAKRFRGDQKGSTAIEYCVIAASVGAAVAGTVWSLGAEVKATFYAKLLNLF